jgi:hypothetical protein
MTDKEFSWLKTAIDEMKSDFKEEIAEMRDEMKAVIKRVDDFIANHPQICYFLTWQKTKWKKAVKVLVVAGVVVGIPTFILGMIDVIKTILGVK